MDNFYYSCLSDCDEDGLTCGNLGLDTVPDQAFKLVLSDDASVTVEVSQLDGYAFIVDEKDATEKTCSLAAEVKMCGPTAIENKPLERGTYYLVVEKRGGGAGNFTVTISADFLP